MKVNNEDESLFKSSHVLRRLNCSQVVFLNLIHHLVFRCIIIAYRRTKKDSFPESYSLRHQNRLSGWVRSQQNKKYRIWQYNWRIFFCSPSQLIWNNFCRWTRIWDHCFDRFWFTGVELDTSLQRTWSITCCHALWFWHVNRHLSFSWISMILHCIGYSILSASNWSTSSSAFAKLGKLFFIHLIVCWADSFESIYLHQIVSHRWNVVCNMNRLVVVALLMHISVSGKNCVAFQSTIDGYSVGSWQ
jgi:hypothetical protein